MSDIPTRERGLARRYLDEHIKRLESRHANNLVPKSKTWQTAISTLGDRIADQESPVKRAAMINKATVYLNTLKPAEIAHIMFGHHSASRSASLCFAGFNVDLHPLIGKEGERGLHIIQYLLQTDRHHGYEIIAGINLAYINEHSIGRLYQRGYDITTNQVTALCAFAGVLGHLTRYSEKHYRGELNLHFHDVLVTGSLKHGYKHFKEGGKVNGTFYDVRTVLEADEVTNKDKLQQGKIAAHLIAKWMQGEIEPHNEPALAEQIPYLPRREDDYTLKH